MATNKILASLSALLSLDTKGFEQGVKRAKKHQSVLQKSMSAIGPAIAGAFAVGSVVSFFKTSLEGLAKEEKAHASLLNTLKGRTETTNRLIDQAKELSKTTLYEDDEIISAQALLGVFVKQEDQLKALTPLVADFATKFGVGLDEAAKTVGKAFLGSGSAFKKLGFEVEGANGSAQRFQSVLEQLNDKVAGAAVAAAETNMGAVEKLGKSWGEFGESLVNLIGPGLSKVAKELTKLTDGMERTFTNKNLTGWERFQVIVDGLLGLDNWANGIMDAADARAEAEKELEAGPSRAGYEEFLGVVDEINAKFKEDAEAAKLAAEEAAKLAKVIRENLGSIPKSDDFFSSFEEQTAAIKNNLADFESSMQGNNIFDLMLGEGGSQTAEEFQAQVDSNIAALESWAEATANVSTEIPDNFNAMGEAVSEAMRNMAMVAIDSMGQLVEAMVAGEAIDFGAGILAGIGQIMQDLGKQIILMSGLLELFQASLATLNPFLMAAAGLAFVAAGAVLKGIAKQSAQPMETGGIVPRGFPNDTYPARLTTGEVVLPEPDALDLVSGGGVVVLETVIRGEDLYLINKKMTSKHSRY